MATENQRIVVVCNWHECPFISDTTVRFADEEGLTTREREILALVIDGMTATEISSHLYISQGTVKAHLHRIYEKTGVTGRIGLLAKIRQFSQGL